jgi:hypothetical protein
MSLLAALTYMHISILDAAFVRLVIGGLRDAEL